MKKSTLKIGGIAVVVCLILSACAQNQQQGVTVDYSERIVVSGQAKLDPKSDTAVFPLDRYRPSEAEDRIIDYAIDISIQRCMQNEGFDFQIVDRREGHDTLGFRLFGLWILDKAAKYGYDIPPKDKIDEERFSLNSQTTDQGSDEEFSACLDNAISEFPRIDPVNTIAAQGSAEAYNQTVFNDADGKVIVQEWKDCMADRSIPVTDSDVLVVETSGMGREQAMQIAVADVQCKEATNAVQKLADIDASYQTEIVRQNQVALNDERAKIDETVKAAQDYIDSFAK